MHIIEQPSELPINSGSLGFVPTMGALHAGHMALVERARAENDRVAVSIFVNPMQFAPGEDLDTYPRTLKADSTLLEAAGVDVLYTPTPKIIYPKGFETTIKAGPLATRLCGAARPGHFDGVCTVVAKLLNQLQPERSYFGEKDWQQLTIIRRMVRDLNMRTVIQTVPTLREPDGLAMSSRNGYLSDSERHIAPLLYETLQEVSNRFRRGEAVKQTLENAKTALTQGGFTSVDYIDHCDCDSLESLSTYQPGARLLAAAKLGKARLIDNIAVD